MSKEILGWCRYPLPREDALERGGVWGPPSDLDYECWEDRRDRLEDERALQALFPGFSLADIIHGLDTPACEETKDV